MHLCCALFVLAELLSIAQGPGAPKTLVTKILHEGDPAPGVPGAYISFPWNMVQPPSLDNAGNVVLDAFLTGSGITPANDYLLYYGPPGALQILAREGDPAPDLPGLKIALMWNITNFPLSEDGWVAFVVQLSGPGVIKGFNDYAAYVGPWGDVRLLARTGDPAPGLEADGTIMAWKWGFGPQISDSHGILLHTDLAGPKVDATNDRAMYVGSREKLELVWRKGMQAPGTDPGVTFTYPNLPVFNDAGQVAFRGALTGPGVDETNDDGLWLGGPGALTKIARDGDPVPGFPADITYGNAIAGLPTINSAGDTSADALLQGPGFTTDNDDALYVAGAWPFEILGRSGDPVPEIGPAVEIDVLGNSRINARHEIFYVVKFRGDGIDDTNRWAMYFGPYWDSELTLRDGDPAPWLPAGIALSAAGALSVESAMNDMGDIVGASDLVGGDVTVQNNVVLWLRSAPAGQWLPLLRSNSIIGGRFVRASDFSDFGNNYNNKTGGSDGQAQSFNDGAQLAMRIEFTDGTDGIYALQTIWPGDLNCDGFLNAFDIEPFVLALTDASSYETKYPTCSPELADLNADGKVDAFDIDPFVHLLVASP